MLREWLHTSDPFVIFLSLVVAACAVTALVTILLIDPVTAQEQAKSADSFATANINYFRDPRTNLCFSRIGVTVRISHVPCTEEVQMLLKNPAR